MVTTGATTTVDEQLVALGTITGRVTTADGLPAAGVSVYATNQFTSQFTATDSNGVHVIPVFPGSYQIEFVRGAGSLAEWAHQQRFQFNAASFAVASGGTTVVDEQLLPTGTVAGRLVDSNGQPVQFGMVQLVGAGGLFGSASINNGTWQTEV